MRWSIGSEPTTLPVEGDAKPLISLGVGYLADASSSAENETEDLEAVVANKPVHFGEPLMVLRLARLFGLPGQKLWMNAQLRNFIEKADLGFRFEQAMVMTLMDSFSHGFTPLGSIFHVDKTSESLKVRLVALKRFSDGELATVPVTWKTGCGDRWGFSASNPGESLRFFTEPRGIPFLLPDKHMGPDLFFFGQEESSNELIAFGVQCRIRASMTTGNWRSAHSTLRLNNFYTIVVRLLGISNFDIVEISLQKDDQRMDYAPKSYPNIKSNLLSALDDLLGKELSQPAPNSIRAQLRSSKHLGINRKTLKYFGLVAPTNDETIGTNVVAREGFGAVRSSLFKDYLGSTSSVLTEPKPRAIPL